MIRSIFTNFSARLAVAALNFCMLLLTTHFLGKEIRGEISIIQLSVNIIHLISDLAGGPSLVYLIPRTRLRTLLFTGSAWSVFTALGIGSALLWFDFIPGKYGVEVLLIGLLISLHSLNLNILLGQQRIKAFNLLFLTQGLLQFGTMSASIFFFHQQQSLPYIHACIAGYGLCYLAGLYLVHRNPPIPHLEESRPVLAVLFSNGFFSQAASLFLILNIRNNYSSLEKHFSHGTGEVGLYSTAFSLAEAILLFAASVSAVVMSKVSNQGDPKAARATVIRLSKLSLALTVIGAAGFLVLPGEFYSWLLGGKDYLPVKQVFLTLTPGVLLVSFGTVYSHYFSGAGKQHINFISGLIVLAVSLLVSQPLVNRYGIEGAGYSSSLTYGALAVFIFVTFMLTGRNAGNELKQLVPSRDDFRSLRELFKRKG